MRTRKVKQSAAVVTPPPPARDRFVPQWHRDGFRTVDHASTRIDTFLQHVDAGEFRLPRFQRHWRWTDADILALLTSLFDGDHVGTILTWERHGLSASAERFGEHSVASPAGSAYLVIDGQQRIGALCTAVHSGRFFFDLESGSFIVGGPGPWRCPVRQMFLRHISDEGWWFEAHAGEYGLDKDRVFDMWSCALNMMDHAEIHAYRLNYRWALPQVVELYRRLNSTGVRMSPDDLEAGLAREMEQKTPAGL